MRAPVSRSRRLDRAGGLAVADRLRVGEFGLAGDVAFGLAHHSGSGPDAAAVLPARRAGGDLQTTDLLAVIDGCPKA